MGHRTPKGYQVAFTTAHIVVDPSDGPHVTLADDGTNGGTVRLKFNRGDVPVASLVFHTAQGSQCDAADAVESFLLWLDMVAAETKLALADWTHGVGEQPEPF